MILVYITQVLFNLISEQVEYKKTSIQRNEELFPITPYNVYGEMGNNSNYVTIG